MSGEEDDAMAKPMAVKAFESSIKGYLAHMSKKHGGVVPKDKLETIWDCVGHAGYVFSRLEVKRRSLQEGVASLQSTCTPQCIAALKKIGQNSESEKQSEHITDILFHWFQQFLRLRDGMTLMTTGECQHAPDRIISRTSTNRRYKSRLGEDASRRRDGYTHLYSAVGGYTGWGYDEFYDETVGIKHRLLRALISSRKKDPTEAHLNKVWDSLLDRGAQAFEAGLDALYAQQEEIRTSLKHSQTTLESNIQSIFAPCKLTVDAKEKFERIALQFSGGTLTIARQGDNFQITDSRGVLPDKLSLQGWNKIMQLPTMKSSPPNASSHGNNRSHDDVTGSTGAKPLRRLQKGGKCISSATNIKKKRRVIDDSSSESDENEPRKNMQQNNNNQKTDIFMSHTEAGGGLKMQLQPQVVPRKPVDEKENDVSLTAIKSRYNVDARQLETSREQLEADARGEFTNNETEEQNVDRGDIHHHHQEEENDEELVESLVEKMKDLNQDVKRNRKFLKQLSNTPTSLNDSYQEEMLAIKETLRRSLMSLGNLIRDICEIKRDNIVIKAQYLSKAQSCYEESLVLVKQMEASISNTSPAFQFRRLELLLLRGRAHTNVGIVHMEQALMKGGHHNNNTFHGQLAMPAQVPLLKKSIIPLRDAEECASAMRAHLLSLHKNMNTEEVSLYKLHANNLECFACRWRGCALWYLGHVKEGTRIFERAAHIGDDLGHKPLDKLQEWSPNVLHEEMLLLVERYYAASNLADFAAVQTERTPLLGGGGQHDSNHGESDDRHTIAASAIQAYKTAADLSSLLEKCCSTHSQSESWSDFQTIHQLTGSLDLLEMMQDFQNRWDKRQSYNHHPSLNHHSTTCHNKDHDDSMQLSNHPERSELFRNESLTTVPTRRILLTDGLSHLGMAQRNKNNNNAGRKKRSKTNKNINNDKVNQTFRSAFASNNDDEMQQDYNIMMSTNTTPDEQSMEYTYAPWGDDRLPQESFVAQDGTVQSRPKLSYPALPPELPTDLRGGKVAEPPDQAYFVSLLNAY